MRSLCVAAIRSATISNWFPPVERSDGACRNGSAKRRISGAIPIEARRLPNRAMTPSKMKNWTAPMILAMLLRTCSIGIWADAFQMGGGALSGEGEEISNDFCNREACP
ncbi:MAG: hypothetical protein E5V36_03310 [Mesorhizobium sp.]|nr:MAG: hypothetical protein E5V36_03310 [Mesorhizobium sp.]